MQKNKLNLLIYGVHLLNPYKTVVSHLKQFRKRHAFRARRNGFFGGDFLFRISELTQRERIYVHFANYTFSFRKLQILISQTTDSQFANYRFSFRKLQISISQTTDSHFANYRFPFRKLQVSISQTTDFHFANYRFPFRKLQISISQTTDFHFANYRFPFRFLPFRFANYSKPCLLLVPVSEWAWLSKRDFPFLLKFIN